MSNEEVAAFGVKVGCIRTGAHEPIVLISAGRWHKGLSYIRRHLVVLNVEHCAYSVLYI